MGLAISNAQISVQDGGGAVVNVSNGGTFLYTPGGTATFALQSTSGIQRWNLKFLCPAFAGLHNQEFEWIPGRFNGFAVPMPTAASMGQNLFQDVQVISVVSDGVSSFSQSISIGNTPGAAQNVMYQHSARAVYLAALNAYTNVGGVLTANANGALTNPDGVTVAVGDRVFLPPGIAAAAADVAVYQITSLGGASAKYVLTAASDFAPTTVIPAGTEIHVTEGTVYAGVTWVINNTGTITLGTTTQTWFPRSVIQSLTLVAGTVTITNVPAVSATKIGFGIYRTTANTSTATTGGYHPVGAITPGALGTVSIVIDATIAAGTINNADVSTLSVMICNPV